MKTNLRYYVLWALACLFAMSVRAQGDSATFHPFPKAGEGYYQQAVPADMRADYIALGEQYLGKEWAQIPQETFAEFRTNGNRTHYEAESFGIRTQFACLVMAEIMEQKGRFLPSICQGLHYFLEKEPWWGIPAHYPKAQPERDIQVVDLFNAESSSMLAWTIYMLGSQIDGLEPGLTENIRSEISRRFLHPTLHEKQGWKHNANNWNTWITSNWLECVLICERDFAEREAALRGVGDDLKLFSDGYPADGGCEEGVGYWDRAGASLFESLYFLEAWNSHGAQSHQGVVGSPSSSSQQLRNMGRFITMMHIHDLRFVNFSDASAESLPNINILFPFGAYLKDTPMMEFAAYIADRYDYFRHPSRLFLASGNYPTLGRELMLLSMLPQLKATKAAQPRTNDAFLENSQIMVASNDAWLLAAKGGNNNESHNHNDIGTFILYHNNEPVVIDLGRDTYTSQTFGNRRYEMMNNRSLYHNVPFIQGCEQSAGKEYKATDVSHESTSRSSVLTMSIEKAYPAEANVQKWVQTLTLDRESNSVSAEMQFQTGARENYSGAKNQQTDGLQAATRLTLMCYGQPRIVKKGVIALHDGQVLLQYDAKLLTPAVEKLVMNDGIMKEQWRDNVYHLTLTLTKKGEKKGAVGYRFVQNAR